ncbi:pyridoxal phosphate-dependent aminotransferase family protein [Fulvivirga sp. RKSG066]|nr:pyridoxal phosphate-dependent aminotransferase family protein [Fulvivirga aurantia]
MHIEKRLQKELQKRLADNNLRSLKTRSGLVDFFSNDYLGLSRSAELRKAISIRNSETKANGATGSRLLSGNSELYEDTEKKLASILESESALIFNSGYMANMALLSAIPKKDDTIVYDELSHACIKDGARLSLAKRLSFKHNDVKDLELKIQKAQGNIFVVVESIYSMDGDQCPIDEILAIAKQYSAHVIIDEAHSTGVFGKNGNGIDIDPALKTEIFARVYTFGKAMGIHGAAVTGSSTLKEYLINHARSFIYTTALPPHSVISIDCAFEYLAEHIELQQIIKNKVKLFNQLFEEKLVPYYSKIDSNHPIQAILTPGNENSRTLAQKLVKSGYDIRPILSPTVPAGKERIRICLHTFNSDDEISHLVDTLAALK